MSLRHPRRALAIALVVIAALVIAGVGLEDRLSPSTLDIRDTPVHRANELLGRHFGDSAPFVILLRGPAAAIDRQGPELIRALRRDPEVTTLSPWDRGLVGRLRPAPRRALIIADYHVGIDEAVDERVPLLDRTLDEKVRAPVRATQSGFATLSRSIQEESIAASERGEAIALPILLIVLLLVFRSPLAAAIPLGFGVLAVLASRGLLAILTTWFEVSALALTVCTMMGLALGVDYALLLVSRFREELASGASPIDAAWTTRRTAGRTTVFAGSTLALSMLVALFVVPGALLASLAGTLALVVVLNVLIATFVGPPLLVLMGANIERWPIGRPGAGRSKLMAVVSVALRRPGPVAAAIALVVLILAAPALALKTGPFSVGQLSRDDPVRRDYEIVQKSFPGFEAPFVIVAATGEGAITEPARLRALTRFQRRIAAIPGVQSVVGPGQFSKAVEPLREAGSDLLSADDGTGPGATLDRLGHNLGRVAGGVAALRAGVSQATYGAGLLAAGSGSSEAGAAALVRGLGGAIAGTREAVDVIDGFARGSRRLRNAQSRASVGALALKFGIRDLIPNLRRNALVLSRKLQESLGEEYGSRLPLLTGPALVTEQKLEVALQRLEGMTDQRADPDYAAVLDAVRAALAALSGTDPVSGQSYAPDYAGLPTELPALQARLRGDAEDSARVTSWLLTADIGLKRLAGLAKRLSDGLTKITTASTRLSRAAATLDREAGRLSSGVGRLGSGATELASGLGRLTDATAELERRLGGAYRRSRPLQAGLGRARVRVLSQGDAVDRRVGNLRRLTPGIFDSGYFVLSALDGTRGRLRERGVEAVDLDRGGQAATLTVFSRFGFNSAGSLALNERLEDEAAALGAAANLTTGVAGGPPTLNTYGRVTKDRLPYVVAAITLVTLLVLILVLRAIPLAAIAVGLNLATVGVAFGVLTLLTHVPGGWPLGGRGYVDAVGATMIFGVVFGLSIDYAVFLLVRMRDHYDREGDSAAAVAFGLEKTAGVITGAAAIMMAVFIAFAGAPVATVSQLGIGLTVAVLLDATVVRIVLLPALMLLLGDRAWWLPRPVERLLPKLEI